MKGRRVRLFLRLTTDVNDRLRALMRYHGELSRYIDERPNLAGSDEHRADANDAREERARNHGYRVRLCERPSSRSGQATRLHGDCPREQRSRQVARRKACLTKKL
jgi:hypothetical protein